MSHPTSPGRPASVLAVDDDPAILDMIAEFLSDEGYEVVATGDGNDALARAAAHQPAVILLDLMMPTISGWQVVGELRASARTRHIPIVLLSARHDLPAAASDLGVLTFLEKPFDLDELLALVEQFAGPAGTGERVA